ncbi:hypothetical protein [uncultured Aggregatibacter sp.]|uniref:hypothetical protein n=1 Tax=uncultured Aggregatibacter sp. TaxID=470564 RepID=UPI001A480FF8|nr:hypothetical protein [uncultured Aggregatibacter sp.]VTX60370.1 Uncharacterised protein [uncultured Aggregatibacter sp.]
MRDAEKFGHTVGRFFKKIDRTLSFLPERPRKAVITAAVLTVSPVWFGIIAYKTKGKDVIYSTQTENEYEQEENCTLLGGVDLHASLGDDNYDGWRFGKDGYGLYAQGRKVI